MNPQAISAALAALEQHVHDINASLVQGDAPSLLRAAESLRQGAVRLGELLQSLTPQQRHSRQLKLQLSELAANLAMGRDNLARRSVLVERTLQTLVPAVRNNTYAPASAGPYGNVARPSGSFKSLAA